MKYIKIIFFLILAFSLVACIDYEEVELLEVNNAEMISLSPDGAVFNIEATVKNPNDYNINLETKDLKVFLNGNFLGTANFKEKIKLQKNSTQKYKVVVISTIPSDGNIDIGTIMASTLFSGLKVKVEGDVRASAKGISKTFPISFTENIDL